MRLTKLFWITALTTITLWAVELRADINTLMAEAANFAIVVERLPDALSSSLDIQRLENRIRTFSHERELPIDSKSRNGLYLRISGAPIRESDNTIGYAYNVHLFFKQNARAMKSDAVTTVSSWSSRGTSGVAQHNALVREIEAAVHDELSEFAGAWADSHVRR